MGNYKYTIRLMSGGTQSSDKDNEWDRLIVNGPVGSDNAVWNWSGIYSWTSTTATNSSSARTVRGNSSAGNFATVSTLNNGGFRPVLIVEYLPTTKYLFQDGSEIKKYVAGTGWVVIGSAPATEAMFQTDGIADLSIIDKAAIDALVSSQPKLLMWTDAPNPSAYVNLTAVPKDHVVMPTDDINLPGQGISGFTLASAATGLSSLRVIASVDHGATWKTWNGSSWVSINPADLAAVKTNGMIPDIFNSLTEGDWNALLNGSNKIRFAYYLEQDKPTDNLYVDQIAINGKPVASQTPTLDSIKVTYDELTVEGRLQDLERINAINIAKLNFKSNALLRSEKYKLHDLIIDTFENMDGIENSETTATYDTINKEFSGVGQVVLQTETLPAGRKKLMITPDAEDTTFEISLDGGATWEPATPFTIIDLTGKPGNDLKIKGILNSASSKLKGIAFSWV